MLTNNRTEMSVTPRPAPIQLTVHIHEGRANAEISFAMNLIATFMVLPEINWSKPLLHCLPMCLTSIPGNGMGKRHQVDLSTQSAGYLELLKPKQRYDSPRRPPTLILLMQTECRRRHLRSDVKRVFVSARVVHWFELNWSYLLWWLCAVNGRINSRVATDQLVIGLGSILVWLWR